MAKGRIRKTDKIDTDQFVFVDDQKLRMTLIAIADKYDEATRDYIKKVYDDPQILNIYRLLRTANSLEYSKGGGREIIKFPDRIIYEFLDTVLSELYGPNWLQNNRALKNELLLPWYVIPFNKL